MCRKEWLRSILFDRTSILSVEQAVYQPNTQCLGVFSTFSACTMQDVVWSSQACTDLCVPCPWDSRAVKNTVCLSLPKFCVLPVSILNSWWSVNWLHIQYDKCTRIICPELTHCVVVRDQWDCVLNDLEELGDKEFRVLTSQYNIEIFFLVTSASCHFALPHFIRPTLRVAKFVPEDNPLISRIQSHHLLPEVVDHDEKE